MSSMIRGIVYFGLLYSLMGSNLLAGNCDNKLFSLNVEPTPAHSIKIKDVLSDLAASCRISVLHSDALTAGKLDTELNTLYIKDFTLNELFELLLHENNLFYEYDSVLSRLNISYLKTHSFNIDYINITQMRTFSAREVTVGASTNQNEDSASMGGTQSSSSSQESGSQNIVEYSSLGSIKKGDNTDFTSTKAISDFTFWEQLKYQIDGILQRDGDSNEVRSWSMVNRDAGIITVSGSYKQLDRVKEYIDHVQKRMHKQVLLETRILEVTFTDEQQIGIDWSKFELSLNAKAGASGTRQNGAVSHDNLYTAGFNFTMEGLINFLKVYGEVEILSSPKVMTLNNQPALINVGDQLNYRYQNGQIDTIGSVTPSASTTFSLGSVFVGLSLTIIPEVTDDGHVILRINPVSSRIQDSSQTGGDATVEDESGIRSIPPDMKIKQLTSIVKVKDGSKVLIGGLVQKEKLNIDTKVPLLGDIPYFGRLFHSTTKKVSKKEFFVVVIPQIIKQNRIPTIEEEEIIQRTQGRQFDTNQTNKTEKI